MCSSKFCCEIHAFTNMQSVDGHAMPRAVSIFLRDSWNTKWLPAPCFAEFWVPILVLGCSDARAVQYHCLLIEAPIVVGAMSIHNDCHASTQPDSSAYDSAGCCSNEVLVQELALRLHDWRPRTSN